MKLMLLLDDDTVIGEWQVQMIPRVRYPDWQAKARADIQAFLDARGEGMGYGGLELEPMTQRGGDPQEPKP